MEKRMKTTFTRWLVIGMVGVLTENVPLRAELRPPKQESQQLFREMLASAQGNYDALDAALDAEILAFQSLIEEGLVFRRSIAAIAMELNGQSSSGKPLTGADLDRLNIGSGQGVELARRIFTVIDTHALWHTVSDQELQKAGFSVPLPVPLQTKGTMLSLAGSLFLYDTYRLEISALAENDKLRRILNSGDPGYENKKNRLDAMTEEYLSLSKRDRVATELRFCEENQFATAAYYGGQDTLRWLQQMVAQSGSLPMLRASLLSAPATLTEQSTKRMGMIFGDLQGWGEDSLNMISLCFGNTVGLVEVRKGKLWGDANVASRLKETLRPGDVLLEKTPFRLTDTFIPGHWGHVAIWVGTEEDLKALGVWDDPVVKPYQNEIRQGKSIVEALRPGVTLNTVEHFLNIDDLGVLRRNPALDTETLRHHILLAFRQIGKAYDFNFDVEKTDKIVCSELAYAVYTDMVWPTDKALGRFTISPDNVALKALSNGPFELVLFYHDGQLVTDRPVERMAELMRRD